MRCIYITHTLNFFTTASTTTTNNIIRRKTKLTNNSVWNEKEIRKRKGNVSLFKNLNYSKETQWIYFHPFLVFASFLQIFLTFLFLLSNTITTHKRNAKKPSKDEKNIQEKYKEEEANRLCVYCIMYFYTYTREEKYKQRKKQEKVALRLILLLFPLFFLHIIHFLI